MADSHHSKLIDQLSNLLPDDWIEQRASELGVLRRRRKIDPVALVWTLALGFKHGHQRSFAALRRRFMDIARMTVASSSWRERFTPELARLMRDCALEALERLGKRYQGKIAETVHGFREILALDACVMRLASGLANDYPATRTNHTDAAAKLHVVINVHDFSPRKVKICEEKKSDQASWRRLGPWVKGRLLMTDLGYYDFNFFRRIENQGGYFLSRLKTNANPIIVEEHGSGPGRRRTLAGLPLQEALDGLTRQVVEVTARFKVRKRAYNEHQSHVYRDWRVIAIRNDESACYHLYVTNVSMETLCAKDVAQMYRLRWQVEIFFKMLKSHGRIHHLNTTNKAAVETLIWAGVLAAIASMKVMKLVRRKRPSQPIPALRFQTLFADLAGQLLESVGLRRYEESQSDCLDRLLYESIDRNKSRPSTFKHFGF
jgi:hypothetical protein